MSHVKRRNPKFSILVADDSDVVALVGSRLLAAALDNKRTKLNAAVHVAVQSPSASRLTLPSLPQLPQVVASIRQDVPIAQPRITRRASLVVCFTGANNQLVSQLRAAGSQAPLINLCSIVPALEGDSSYLHGESVAERLLNATTRFALDNKALDCLVCKQHRDDDTDFWLNIANICSRFSHALTAAEVAR